jgi:site-specific DNA-methyltransferase (adenine-specific)
VEMKNTLYYGDNVDVLREYIPDESAELIYLDPPFNYKQAYNVIFGNLQGVAEREAGAEGQGLQ